MRRIISFIILLVVFATLVCGCVRQANIQEGNTAVADKLALLEKIAESWETDEEGSLLWFEDYEAYLKAMQSDHAQYIGTFYDCIIFIVYEPPESAIDLPKNVIGDYCFDTPQTGAIIYAYKDGEIYKLEQAYKDGIFSEELIAKIHKQWPYNNSLPENSMTQDTTAETLPDSLRAEILAYFGDDGKHDNEHRVAGYYYYGTYNGYVVLMSFGPLAVSVEIDIGGRIFKWGSNMNLIAYKDAAAYDLKEVYDNGGITVSHLDQILVNHKAHFSQVHNWAYNEE